MAQRGSYAKGIAKREEILERALDVIARSGVRGASVKEIADAVGLSQPGLLHYFGSKEELFTAVLRKRDQHDGLSITGDGPPTTLVELRSGLLALVRHNASVPGLVELFSRLAVDAADEDHPAHAYFAEREAALQTEVRGMIEAAQAAGALTSSIPAESIARLLQASLDGMQLQWLADPTIDMAAVIDDLFTLLSSDQADHA